jgi:hypothetical protein
MTNGFLHGLLHQTYQVFLLHLQLLVYAFLFLPQLYNPVCGPN